MPNIIDVLFDNICYWSSMILADKPGMVVINDILDLVPDRYMPYFYVETLVANNFW